MHPKKKPLSLNRETIRQLVPSELLGINAAINVRTVIFCVPATQAPSCFDSCFDTDCCLEVP